MTQAAGAEQAGSLARGACLLTGALLCFGAYAQPSSVASPPTGLKWEWMKEVVFNSSNFSSTGSESDRSLAQAIWGPEIEHDARQRTTLGLPSPGFSLIGSAAVGAERYVFTMYSSASRDFKECAPPPNGREATRIYTTCPMRVVASKEGHSILTADFPGYCMLFGDDPNNPRSRNHVEFAVDSVQEVAYFRAIQHGRQVADCNRSVRLRRS